MNHDAPATEVEALVIIREGDGLLLRFHGEWRMGGRGRPGVSLFHTEFAKEPAIKTVRFDLSGVKEYDSALITFLLQCYDISRAAKTTFDIESLPEGPRQLLRLATAVPEAEDARPNAPQKSNFFTWIGCDALTFIRESREIFEFIGQCVLAVVQLAKGKARFRWSDVWLNIQQCGSQALPIVSLISFLVGLILAYVGAITLRQYGGTIFIANLVGLAMTREMGAMMTGVIMSGRTGAAFAAQLGTMKVSEEIAALSTLGLSPIEFLVLPRMIALFLMFPLLTLYANFIGMFGGLVVALSMQLSYSAYKNQLIGALTLTHFSVGMIKSLFFGLIVAMTGCLRGMQCGNSSAAVGEATTRAVVSGITCMIIADAIFAVIFNILNM